MVFHKKISTSVVIVCHNNERTITYLIRSLLKQNLHNYILDRIIIICDGSSDHTPAKVSKYAALYPQITFLYYAETLGASLRIENIVNTVTSDVVLLLEPDIVLKGTNFIRDLLSRFYAEKIVLVSPVCKMSDGMGLVNYLNKKIHRLCEEMARITRDNHLYYSLNHDAIAVRTDFIKNIKFHPDIDKVSYLYFTALYDNNLTLLCESAVIIKNYHGIISSLKAENRKLAEHIEQNFGNLVQNEMRLKSLEIAKITLSFLIRFPYTSLLFCVVKSANFIGGLIRPIPNQFKVPQTRYALKKRLSSY